jgi:sugar lactone lactonase YvrE
MVEVEHFLPVQNKLGEGPVWSVEEQALYWVDQGLTVFWLSSAQQECNTKDEE